ncbi:MAG: Lon protease [Synergistetes bacterium ADurb.Bin155]|jgi:lon-related putative ATP-dependent protease|nr:AAA family ATPase [Synergistales bacterium]MBP8996532.1 AAA family ATPase [Synergistales bacterium]OQB45272.1 MAG: Lon protease [Synergistetes bacterium ADurb.Bin155]
MKNTDNLLTVEQLRKRTESGSLGFETTLDVPCLEDLIGQERAVQAMTFGMAIKNSGYNIFVVGDHGSGRTTYALERLQEQADSEPAPKDYIYAFNFDNPEEPLAIDLPAGQARDLASHLEELVEELKSTLSKAFENSQYEDAKAQLVKEFQEQVNQIMEELRSWAKGKGFVIKRTPQGFVNIPMTLKGHDKDGETEKANQPSGEGPLEGKSEADPSSPESQADGKEEMREMVQEDFESLTEDQKKVLQGVSEEVSQRTLEILRRIRDLEKTLKEKIKELESEISRAAIDPYLQETRDRFGKEGKIGKWLDALSEDIISNFNMFIAAARDEGAEVDFSRYLANVFVSNDPSEGAPVVWETNPTYYNLCGKVEYESRQGMLTTDFRKIIPGVIHKANGGYLVLQAEEVLRNFLSWDALKRALKTGELVIENLGEQLGVIPVSSLRPEAIPVDLKVVMIGTRYLYHLLMIYDPEYQKLFKIKADFDIDMPRDAETERQMACFVAGFAKKEGLLPFSSEAVSELIEWSARLSGNVDRMSTQFNRIAELIVESSAWAADAELDVVGAEQVRRALREKNFRVNLVEEKIRRAFAEDSIRILTEGAVVGQINGLTVVDMGDHVFGHPVRITSNVYMGAEGIVNIEREVKMTGPIHNKGLLILESFLGRKFARVFPLSLTARITFEQTYGGIEGDSASSTELYCILSALAEVPLKQGIAVTGSVDQHGNIQPIGGVNEKIEGFFEYCRLRGFTGDQGVIIPRQNVKNLMLSHEVIDAVMSGEFKIWAVSTIEEGISILTGEVPGEMDEKGEFTPRSIYSKVHSKLKDWYEKALKQKKHPGPGKKGKPEDRESAEVEDEAGK